MGRYSKTERVGVNAVEAIVVKELGWIFREQLIVDMGIDAQIERVDNGIPTGKLIAVQIKTGESHFKETKDAFTYYGRLAHLDYWTGHSLPVILVAHLPSLGKTFWALINEATVQRTKRAWKIAIPKINQLGRETMDALSIAAEGSPPQQRLRKLSIDEPLMRHIQNGGKVSLELEDWVNKSLGRTPVKVFVHDEDGNETLSRDLYQYYVGYGIKELAEALFPWATASVDVDFYEQHSDLDDDWHEALKRATDEDNGVAVNDSYSDVYPYSETAGEVEHYRLELLLNELGRAFLTVTDYMQES